MLYTKTKYAGGGSITAHCMYCELGCNSIYKCYWKSKDAEGNPFTIEFTIAVNLKNGEAEYTKGLCGTYRANPSIPQYVKDAALSLCSKKNTDTRR